MMKTIAQRILAIANKLAAATFDIHQLGLPDDPKATNPQEHHQYDEVYFDWALEDHTGRRVLEVLRHFRDAKQPLPAAWQARLVDDSFMSHYIRVYAENLGSENRENEDYEIECLSAIAKRRNLSEKAISELAQVINTSRIYFIYTIDREGAEKQLPSYVLDNVIEICNRVNNYLSVIRLIHSQERITEATFDKLLAPNNEDINFEIIRHENLPTSVINKILANQTILNDEDEMNNICSLDLFVRNAGAKLAVSISTQDAAGYLLGTAEGCLTRRSVEALFALIMEHNKHPEVRQQIVYSHDYLASTVTLNALLRDKDPKVQQYAQRALQRRRRT